MLPEYITCRKSAIHSTHLEHLLILEHLLTNHRIHIYQIQKLEYEIYFMTSQHSNTVFEMNQINKFDILAF